MVNNDPKSGSQYNLKLNYDVGLPTGMLCKDGNSHKMLAAVAAEPTERATKANMGRLASATLKRG